MEAARFSEQAFGRAVYEERLGFWWFDPAPLPRQLELEAETQLALSSADAALGRLDGVARLLKNPTLITRPYAAREAVASSRIEGTQASLVDVYQASAASARTQLAQVSTINAYRHALEVTLEQVRMRGVSLDLVRWAHQLLMSGETASPGGWRRTPVWLGSPTRGPETAVFVPPIGERMLEALVEWDDWRRRPPRLPFLVRVALLHYQFLTVHPFLDGNGRVGRMLIQMLLEEERALCAPLLYVSAFFDINRREYFDRLQAVRERGEVQQWLQFFLTAIRDQADDGVARAVGLLDLREEYRAALSGTRSRAAEVVDLLFENPVVTARSVASTLGMTNQGALNLIRSLEVRGWLEELGSGGRGALHFWFAPRILGLFDDEAPPATEGSGRPPVV